MKTSSQLVEPVQGNVLGKKILNVGINNSEGTLLVNIYTSQYILYNTSKLKGGSLLETP